MQQLVFASVFGSNCRAVFIIIIFCPSQAAQLCNLGRDVVRVAAVSGFLGEGALSSASSVDLLQVESSAAARSVRSQRTAVCRNARERRNHCAEMNRLCHDPRQLGLFHPHHPHHLLAPLLGSSAGCVCITIVMPVPSRDTRGRLSLAHPFLRFAGLLGEDNLRSSAAASVN